MAKRLCAVLGRLMTGGKRGRVNEESGFWGIGCADITRRATKEKAKLVLNNWLWKNNL